VQNRRFLLLTAEGSAPNLASRVLGAALRALPGQWHESFGYRPLLAESFTDPETYAGTCYKASGWEAIGMSEGYSRHRADFYVANDRPKRLWMHELGEGSLAQLRAGEVPDAYRQGVCKSPPGGVLPLSAPQMRSLFEVLRQAPDPRAKNTRFRIGAVLTLIAMALLAGRRDISEIARFARSLKQPQRRALGLPRRKGRRAFYEVPGYGVFYQVLTRMDAETFAAILSRWLLERAGTLPAALALDGKMIRDHIGLLSLARHEDGAPQAIAIYDQKENTPRCEQSAAAALIESLPTLDGKMITADPLHCQRKLARPIVEKGGDYLFQIKGNQPGLLARARTLDALKATPFFKRSRPDADGSKCATSTPLPLIRSPRISPSPARC
jgi:hypothetical protein